MPSDLLLKVGSIVLLLGGLIFVHELGHFLVAKALGVKVVRFSIGFGPRLFGFKRGETEYRIALLPLGGYVKMSGEDPTEEVPAEDRGRGFLEQKPWKRFAIAAAGPGFNLVFPIVIYFAMAMAQNGDLTAGPRVGSVAPGSPAAAAGLLPGDRILSVETSSGVRTPVRYFANLRELIAPHAGAPLVLEIERDGERRRVNVTPASERESNPIETKIRGVIGVTPTWIPAVVAPTRPGAAGGIEPFDLVVSADGKPVKHWGELSAALRARRCEPVDLEVLREQPVALPGAALSAREKVSLRQVPTCVDGERAFAPADPGTSTFIGSVTPGSPAAEIGLRRGDAIVGVNGREVRSFRDLNAMAGDFKVGQPVDLALADGRKVQLVPAEQTYVDELTRETARRLLLGFQPYQGGAALLTTALLAEEARVTIGPVEAFRDAAGHLSEVVRLTVLGIVRIVSGDISFKTVGGPIMLFSIAAQAAEEGIESFLFKMALISVNLGLMNLLPIPVLDGGHLAACLVEAVTRRPLSLRAREIANLVGIILLVTLMIFVFKNDIARLMG
jgi:regulator of sigma E protease